jgi:hypothetical protein
MDSGWVEKDRTEALRKPNAQWKSACPWASDSPRNGNMVISTGADRVPTTQAAPMSSPTHNNPLRMMVIFSFPSCGTFGLGRPQVTYLVSEWSFLTAGSGAGLSYA